MNIQDWKRKFDQGGKITFDHKPRLPSGQLKDQSKNNGTAENIGSFQLNRTRSLDELKRRFAEAQEFTSAAGNRPSLVLKPDQSGRETASNGFDADPKSIPGKEKKLSASRGFSAQPQPKPHTIWLRVLPIIGFCFACYVGGGLLGHFLNDQSTSQVEITPTPTKPRKYTPIAEAPAPAEENLDQPHETPKSPGENPIISPNKYEPVGVNFGNKIWLVDYELPGSQYRPGETIAGSLFWKVNQPLDTGYIVFVHLTTLDDPTPVVQHDGIPVHGSRATDTWLPHEQIRDPHELQIPSILPSGEYWLRTGMYHADGRLPVVNSSQMAVADDAILLGPIWIN